MNESKPADVQVELWPLIKGFGFLSQGDFVWVDSRDGTPFGAEVTETDTGQLQLLDDEGKVQLQAM